MNTKMQTHKNSHKKEK